MKKRIMMSLLVIGLVSALVGGATFAYFTATDTNSENNFTAATVTVDAEDATAASTNSVNPAIFAPGDVYQGTFTVTNTGDIPVTITAVTPNTSGDLFTSGDATVNCTPSTASIAAGDSADVAFDVEYDSAATEQGKTGTLSFTVEVEQTH